MLCELPQLQGASYRWRVGWGSSRRIERDRICDRSDTRRSETGSRPAEWSRQFYSRDQSIAYTTAPVTSRITRYADASSIPNMTIQAFLRTLRWAIESATTRGGSDRTPGTVSRRGGRAPPTRAVQLQWLCRRETARIRPQSSGYSVQTLTHARIRSGASRERKTVPRTSVPP